MQKQKNKFVLTLSILLPVRNEGINIKLMLKILAAILDVPYEILIVYDNPADKTVPEIKKIAQLSNNVKGVHNRLGKGVINAIKAGTQKASGEYILLLAVDDVGPALAIEDMLVLMNKGCELVSCTRYMHGGRRLGGSWVEAALSIAGNRVFSILSGSSFSDATTGFKMFRRNIFEKIELESKPIGWAVVFEIAIKAQASGLKLGEVPIISIDRLYGGKSSFRLGPWLKEYLRWFFYGIQHYSSLRSNRNIMIRIPRSTIV